MVSVVYALLLPWPGRFPYSVTRVTGSSWVKLTEATGYKPAAGSRQIQLMKFNGAVRGVAAFFYQPAVVQHQNPLGLLHCREAVRDARCDATAHD